MKRFQFPLEKVRHYRKMQAEAEEAKLEAALARVRAIDEQISGLERERVGTEQTVRATLAARSEVEAAYLTTYPDYRFLLTRNRQGLLAQRETAVAAVSRQRAALIQARRDYEVLNQARELAKSRWQAEYAREQEAVASELFLSGWNRRRGDQRR